MALLLLPMVAIPLPLLIIMELAVAYVIFRGMLLAPPLPLKMDVARLNGTFLATATALDRIPLPQQTPIDLMSPAELATWQVARLLEAANRYLELDSIPPELELLIPDYLSEVFPPLPIT